MKKVQRHSLTSGGLLSILVVIAAGIFVGTGLAQTVDCNYSFSNVTNPANSYAGPLNITAGQSGSTTIRVSATGAGCATDSVMFQLWDTPGQNVWPSAQCSSTAGNLFLTNGSSAEAMITCSPPMTGYLGYDPLIRLLRGSNVVNTYTFDLNITAASCSGLTLSTDKQNYTLGEPVILNHSCPSSPSAPNFNLTFQLSAPGSSGYQTVTTVSNTTPIGGYTFNSSQFTAAGTYGIRTCINDTTCASGTNSTSVSFQSSVASGPTLTGTIYRSGTYQDPATGTIRTCTSPNYWMKEGSTSSGARSWHCMSAQPGYTSTTSDTFIPANCGTIGGTLWAGTTLDSDYCSSTAPTGGGGTGSTCPSGQVQCPAVGSSPAGCYVTCPTGTGTGGGTGVSTSCAVGARCPANSWCSNGSQCYYPSGEITCVAWSTSTTTAPAANVQCPSGTSECSPTDTSCVGVGQTVPYTSGKYCRNGQSYYSTDGANMTCVSMNGSAPAGYTSCRPGDTNCIPTGGYGSSSGWCSGSSSQCYQKTTDTNGNNDKYCAPMVMGTSGSDVSCPSGYSVCSPTDTNCFAKGEIIPKDKISSGAWCSNAQKCTLSDGTGSCVGWNESCPVGSKYCSAGDTYCIEPGEYKIISAVSASGSYWCGGSSGGMTFYNKSESKAYCAPRPAGSSTGTAIAMMWTSADVKGALAQLGSGWGLCSFTSYSGSTSKCLEPGQSGSSSDWCGWTSPGSYSPPYSPGMNGNTRTCPTLDGGTVTPPPTSCPAGQVSCQNPLGSGTYCYNGAACPTAIPDDHKGCDTTMYYKNASGIYLDDRGNPSPVSGIGINWKNFGDHWHMCGTQTEPPICPMIIDPPNCISGSSPEMLNGCMTGKCVSGKPAICPIAQAFTYCPPGQVLKTSNSANGCSYTYCEPEGVVKPPKPDDRLYLRQLADQLRGNRFYLKDMEQQLGDADPGNADVAQAKELVEKGKTLAVEIDKLIKAGGVKNLTAISEKMNVLQEQIINELQFLSSSFEVYRQCRSLGEDIRRMQEELSSATYGDEDSEAFRDSLASRLDEVEGSRKDSCARADEFEVQDLWQSVNDIRRDFYEFRDNIFRGISTSHIEEMLEDMRDGYNGLLAKIEEKNIDDLALGSLLVKVDEQMTRCENLVEDGENESARACIDQLTRLFNPVEQLLKKHNISFEVDVRGKDIFEKLVEEKIAKKIESILNEKIANIEAVLEERFQQMAVQLVEITDKIAGLKSHVDEITQAAANVTKLEEKFKQQISDSRTQILAEIQAFELSRVKQANVRLVLENAFACAARTNWMGANGEAVREKLGSAQAVLADGTLTLEDAEATLAFCEQKYAQNVQESFENGATAFRDVATEQWYHSSAQFAFENKFILGTKDAEGNPTHEFVPNQPTLWGEALAMTMRLCSVPVGSSTAVPGGVNAVPWMYSYVNGARADGIDLTGENMTEPITRISAAKLATEVCDVPLSSSSEVAQATYKDFSEFRSDAEGARAVDALTQFGVFQGNNASEFNPGDSLLRTEIAAVLERLANEISQ